MFSSINVFVTPKTILLVDNNPQELRLLAAELRTNGYHVLETDSPSGAQMIVNDGIRVDLLVTAHEMPVLNGMEIATWLRSKYEHIPVLVITTMPEIAAINGLFHPSFVCRGKPLRMSEITQTVAQMFGATAQYRGPGPLAAPALAR